MFSFLADHKASFEALQALCASAAIAVGAVWAVFRFGLHRERFPRARLSHRVELLALDPGRLVLRVNLRIANIGERLLSVAHIENRLQQVLPLALVPGGPFAPAPSSDHPKIPWPMLENRVRTFAPGACEIEPGESECFQFDYLVEPGLRVAAVYSHVKNTAKRHRLAPWKSRQIGWPLTQTFALPPPGQAILVRLRRTN